MKISELMLLLSKALVDLGDVEVVKGCGKMTSPIDKAERVKLKSKPIRLESETDRLPPDSEPLKSFAPRSTRISFRK